MCRNTIEVNKEHEVEETAFGMSDNEQPEERWVIAEPGEELGEWVESEYNKGRRFVDRQEVERCIFMSSEIPSLFKTQLRAKRTTDLTS